VNTEGGHFADRQSGGEAGRDTVACGARDTPLEDELVAATKGRDYDLLVRVILLGENIPTQLSTWRLSRNRVSARVRKVSLVCGDRQWTWSRTSPAGISAFSSFVSSLASHV
jgi:hypothetical protein